MTVEKPANEAQAAPELLKETAAEKVDKCATEAVGEVEAKAGD